MVAPSSDLVLGEVGGRATHGEEESLMPEFAGLRSQADIREFGEGGDEKGHGEILVGMEGIGSRFEEAAPIGGALRPSTAQPSSRRRSDNVRG